MNYLTQKVVNPEIRTINLGNLKIVKLEIYPRLGNGNLTHRCLLSQNPIFVFTSVDTEMKKAS